MIFEHDKLSSRVKFCFWAIFTIIIAYVFGISSVWATPNLDDIRRSCQQSNACYYNSMGNTSCVNDFAPELPGDSNEAKVWNYFVSANISKVSNNPAVIAGILGNIYIETGGTFSPFAGGSSYFGLIQWLKKDNTAFYDELTTKVGDYWGQGNIPEDKINEAIQMELDYLTKDYGAFQTFLNNIDQVDNTTGAKGAESYADLFLVTVERAIETPKVPGTPINDSQAQSLATSARYQGAQERRQHAAEIYRDSSEFSSSDGTSTGTKIIGTGNLNAIRQAKNANKQSGDLSKLSFSDKEESEMKTLLETFGDLAYQTGKAAGVPWIAILVQGRYEDGKAACGQNNYWGIGCYTGTKEGEAAVQAANVGEGFVKYAETVTNGRHNQAVGEHDPIKYLEKLGPTWVQGSLAGSGYSDINGMKNSVKALKKYISTPEGQAIVKTFGNYTGVDPYSDGSNVTWIGDSISVRSESEIKKLLPKVDLDAKVGRTAQQGLDILKQLKKDDKLRNIVVFALGSNGSIDEKLAQEVIDTAGSDRTIVFVTNASRSSQSDNPRYPQYDQHNTLFNSLSDGEHVLVADWAGAVAQDLEKYLVVDSDGKVDVHPSDEGAKLFAETINSVINSNLQIENSPELCDNSTVSHSPYDSDEVPQYFQGDYPNSPFGNSTVAKAGCGPSSFAMMATVLKGKRILPDEVASISGQYYVPGSGSSWGITQFLAGYYGLQYKNISTSCDKVIETINQALEDGWMIHTSGGSRSTAKMPFTSKHYIGITAVNDAGQWYIADSASRTTGRSNKWYDPQDVLVGINCNNIHAIR